MLKLPQVSAFGRTRAYLEAQQQLINNLPTYAEKVASAKKAWEGKSKAIFEEVRATLDILCSGARRCQYCEDSAADEVEHVWPKKFYPEKTFIWQNYLFACGPCNGSNKRDQFSIFDADGNKFDIVRKKGDPVLQPPTGIPLFIDPTSEDPTEYISLDLQTGLFVPLSPKDTREYKRAEYTIKTLGLNSRDYLSRARRIAYASYKDSLDAYTRLKESGGTLDELMSKQAEISEKNHPTVWHEIKVTAHLRIAHHDAFEQSPELYQI
ncbi:hypothetical protein PspR84_17280 [Pseudomonas sp. R84]|uniref:hypothetical protein n=1 Tax=Pseudomonas sp. R84 TaxID=1573712 RepID=UPI00131FC815|nr:hypothetical protein [Pseudomonas sp. R84]QHC96314.1 hypothetical protein PspR84_17280 [Pseudomonas sp. R84]